MSLAISIGVSYHGEGSTDASFFESLIPRVVETSVQESSLSGVVVTIENFRNLDKLNSKPNVYERIKMAINVGVHDYELIFVHADGGSARDRAERFVVGPKRDAIEAALSNLNYVIVPLIPVREMEAWALADPASLQKVFSVKKIDRELELNPPHRVERIKDPKAFLELIGTDCVGQRGLKRRNWASTLNAIGATTSIARLRAVPSFLIAFNHTVEAVKMLIESAKRV